MNNTNKMCLEYGITNYLSYSRYNQPCMYSYYQKYVLENEKPANRAMLMGSLFDEMCTNGYGDRLVLPQAMNLDDADIVRRRYLTYKSHINYDTDMMQMFCYMPIEGTKMICPNGCPHEYTQPSNSACYDILDTP